MKEIPAPTGKFWSGCEGKLDSGQSLFVKLHEVDNKEGKWEVSINVIDGATGVSAKQRVFEGRSAASQNRLLTRIEFVEGTLDIPFTFRSNVETGVFSIAGEAAVSVTCFPPEAIRPRDGVSN